MIKKLDLKCRCGCNTNKTKAILVEKLNLIRRFSDINILPKITSAYRCPDFNKKVGGSKISAHLQGLAVDIKVANKNERYHLIYWAIFTGFCRIGIAETFVHIDLYHESPAGSPIIWLYPPKTKGKKYF